MCTRDEGRVISEGENKGNAGKKKKNHNGGGCDRGPAEKTAGGDGN